MLAATNRQPVAAILLVLLATAGCRPRAEALPETGPVHGVVTNANGQPISGGLVTFEPEGHGSVFTVGEIKSDGTYTLTTSRSGLKSPGAVVGPNRVTVSFAISQSQAPVRPFVFSKPIVVAPGDNEIPLKVEP